MIVASRETAGAGMDARTAALDVLATRARPGWVVIHGGGAEVSAWSERLRLTPRTVEGLRVTDAETLEVVVAVLRGLGARLAVLPPSRPGAHRKSQVWQARPR